MVFFWSGGYPQQEGANFFSGGGIVQHSVMFRKNVELWCGCSIPVAE